MGFNYCYNFGAMLTCGYTYSGPYVAYLHRKTTIGIFYKIIYWHKLRLKRLFLRSGQWLPHHFPLSKCWNFGIFSNLDARFAFRCCTLYCIFLDEFYYLLKNNSWHKLRMLLRLKSFARWTRTTCSTIHNNEMTKVSQATTGWSDPFLSMNHLM